jgi:heptosyltransferase-2
MNLLIIKTGALGDVLRTSFIAQALKGKYGEKNPKIFWLVSKKAINLLEANEFIDYLISEKNQKELKKIKFDLIINLEESELKCKFTSSLNAKKITGAFWKNNKINYSKDSNYWFNMSIISKLGKEKADRLKRQNKKTHRQITGEMLNINWKAYESTLKLNKMQRKFSNNFKRRNNISNEDLIIGINTGSANTWPKSLPIEKTIELIKKIKKNFNVKILLFGGPNETGRNEQIIAKTKNLLIDTGCKNNLKEVSSLISLCNLFISTDSLLLHISLSLKIKSISLIGPTSHSEIDMYGLGNKIISNSKDVCSYKRKTNCMEKINLNEIINSMEKLICEKITLLITSFKEPKTIGKAIESALNQENFNNFEIIISAPDKETLKVAERYAKKNKNIKLFKDKGKGKSSALNLIFEKINDGILILTDGDVWISNNSIEEIYGKFKNPRVGCVSGRPVPLENKKTKYGFWANFLFESAHKMRKKSKRNRKFLECSGYLFAFRKEKIKKIPLNVAEDTIIPLLFWKKGYEIDYAENAKVFVKNTNNWKDWLKQKTRTSKAHERIKEYMNVKRIPKEKSFKNEIKGIKDLFRYPTNFNQTYWSLQLILARLLMWINVILDTKIKKEKYSDNWERIESTKNN